MTTNHVVSFELSLALRDAGYPQEGSTFYWSIPMPERAANEKERLVLSNQCEVQLCHKWTEWGDKFQNVAAPLASELGEVLPASIEGFETYAGLSIEKTDGNFWTVAYENFAYKVHVEKSSHSLADAMAFTLIHLLENKLITL